MKLKIEKPIEAVPTFYENWKFEGL